MLLKELLRKFLPEFLFNNIRKLYYISSPSKRKYRSYHIHNKNGENPECKFYIFRMNVVGYGILAVYRFMLSNVGWAISKGYIPVIDYEWEHNLKGLGTDNIWEMCFEQPMGYSVNEALKGKHVIVSRVSELYEAPLPCAKVVSENYKDYYQNYNIISKRYLRIKEDMKAKFDDDFLKLIPKNARIIGVSVRDGYALGEEAGDASSKSHPKEPKRDVIIEKVKELLIEWRCDYIYLTAELQETVDAFKSVFKEKLLYIDRERITDREEFIKGCKEDLKISNTKSSNEISLYYKNSPRNTIGNEKMISYTEEIYELSLCTHFLGTKSDGTIVALIWEAKQLGCKKQLQLERFMRSLVTSYFIKAE